MVEESNEERKVNLDLVDEVREEARIKNEGGVQIQLQVETSVVPGRRPGDAKAHPYQLENKLSPKWTGPFRITGALGN